MAYERLAAQDAAFLDLEDDHLPMHVGAIAVFGPTLFQTPGGTLAMNTVYDLVASRLPLLPRYRMRLARTPLTGHPIWVDDSFFELRYHIRHVCLPAECSAEAFDELASRFLSQKLDRSRPLWEILIADGLEGGRIGAVFKAHHALIDGVSGVDMLILLLGTTPSAEVPEPPDWEPRPVPAAWTLVSDELRRRTSLPLAWIGATRAALADPRGAASGLRDRALGVGQVLQYAMNPGPVTPLNGSTGPNRRLARFRVELEEIKKVRRSLGGTVNDIAVAIAAGALRRFFAGRGVQPDRLDVRAMIPVSTRTEVDRGKLGNKLAVLLAPLPVGKRDPHQRLLQVRHTMDELKTSKAGLGNEMINLLAEWTSPQLISEMVRLSARLRAMHVMVTNIRGPAEPLYFLDAPLLEVYPAAPLWPGQTLTMGIMSYSGWLHWGLAVDADHLPDVDHLTDAVRVEIQELSKMAREAAGAGGDTP